MGSECSYQKTGTQHVHQEWAPCYDCFPNEGEGACMHCIETCHKGHRVGTARSGNFYCDCGHKGKCSKNQISSILDYGSSIFSPPARTSITATDIYQSSNVLAQKLFDVIGRKSVYSPLSIAYIMSLLHLGSSGNTEAQITKLMTVINTTNDLMTCLKIFKLANVIMVNKDLPIEPEYLQMAQQLALVSSEDFSNCSAIVNKANSFIEKNTNNLIKDILKEDMISPDTAMILVNIIYFKEKWELPFKQCDTRKEKFNSMIELEMMTNTKYYPYHEDDHIQLVELSYVGNKYCMGFILPKNRLTVDNCIGYIGKDFSRAKMRFVEVHIPKFTQRKKIDLIPLMKKMGVTDIFSSKDACLDKMISANLNTYVSTMIHEAVVIVDEDGTEAAATTMAVCTMESCCMTPNAVVFNANRSFVYYIKHYPTNTLLFVGDFHGN